MQKRRGIGKGLRNYVHIGKQKAKSAVVVSVDDDGGDLNIGMMDYPFSQVHQTTQSSPHRLDNGKFGGSIETDNQFTQILFLVKRVAR